MKFLMIVCEDESNPVRWTDADFAPWLAETARRGVRVEGAALSRTSDATTVRDSGRLISDGPYAETKEQIAGYDVLDCADLDEAIEIAARHPVAAVGAIEVRPFWSE